MDLNVNIVPFADAILIERPNVSWDNVAGLVSAKKTLIEGVVLPLKYPDLFSGMYLLLFIVGK